jgi:Sulfotransferase family
MCSHLTASSPSHSQEPVSGRIRHFAITFVCEPGDLELKAVLLAATLRRYIRSEGFEMIAAVPLPVGQWADRLPVTAPLLQQLGAELVEIRNELDPTYRIGHKVSCLNVPTRADKLLFLDSDILCMREFGDQPRFSIPFNAKPADLATFPADVAAWDAVYATAGLSTPTDRVVATVSGQVMPPYFNAGFIAVDRLTCLAETWLDCCKRIDATDAIPHRRPHLDQIALPVALRRLGLAYDCLDERYNFPAHLKPLSKDDPFFCHYHGPSVIQREPCLLDLVRSIAEEYPAIADLMRSTPGWAALLGAVRPNRSTSRKAPSLIITGIPRSGTSYLCNLLHRYEDCVVLNEPAEIFAALARQVIPWEVATFYRDVRAKILRGESVANKLRDGKVVEDTTGLHETTKYSPSVQSEDFVLGTKNTLAYLARVGPLRRVMPDARFVACVRDPLDTIASWKTSFPHLRDGDTSWPPVGGAKDLFLPDRYAAELRVISGLGSPALRRAAWWRLLAEMILDQEDRLTLIRYTDLVHRPREQVERILSGFSPRRALEPLEPSSVRRKLGALEEEDFQAVRSLCSQSAAALGLHNLGI